MGLGRFWAWRGLGVGAKVVAPFAALTLLLGLVVSAVAAQELAMLAGQQQALLATRAEDNVNTVLNSVEERELDSLRLLSATPGLAAAVGAADPSRLRTLLLPGLAEQLPVAETAVVVDTGARQVLTLAADASIPGRCLCSSGGGAAGYPHLGDVLAGRADAYGGIYLGLVPWDGTRLVYTIGPVLDEAGRVAGALLVGERLDAVLAEVERSAGVPAAVFGPASEELAASPRYGEGPTKVDLVTVPWVLRYQQQGRLSLAVPTAVTATRQAVLVVVLVAVWLLALLLALAVGSFVSRSLTRPLGAILEATREVARGNLKHRAPVESEDEIGRVAASFNTMIETLDERSGRLARQHEDTLLALAAALESRDQYTHGHSVRVAVYSQALADAAGLGLADLDALERGCLVHDIGKIGVPDQVLLKPGRLSPWERQEMNRHPLVGARMLEGLDWPAEVTEIILHHHERWDGAGYPARLRGERIPVLARLVAIADALDAMTSHRPYRAAFSYRRAAAEIWQQSAAQFDPELVAAFRRAKDELGELVTLMSGDQQIAEYLESEEASPVGAARAPRLKFAS